MRRSSTSSCRPSVRSRRWGCLGALFVFVAFLTGGSAIAGERAPARLDTQVAVPRLLTLPEAEALLLKHSLAVAIARHQVEAAQAERLIASVRPNPTLNLGATQFPFTKPFANAAYNIQQYEFGVDQVIERGNKRGLRTAVAEQNLRAAELQVLDAIRTQRFQLQQSFVAAQLARDNIYVAEENLGSINDTERLIRTQVDAGQVPEGDLIKFQANRVQFQQALLSAKLAYEQAVRDILNLLGASPSDVVGAAPPDGSPAFQGSTLYITGDFRADTVTATLPELRAAAADNRPDVLAAERSLEAASKNVDLQMASRTRDLTVGAQYLRVGPDNTFGVTMSFPLFIFNYYRGEIDRANAQRRQAEVALRQVMVQANTDVEKAYQANSVSRQTLGVYTSEALQRAEESYRIAEQAYREGASTLLDLLDARRTLNQTRVAANQARSDYATSLYQLEQAVGKP